ncbi:DUF302 domain-containing protein [Catenulispora rubra]|uniref:DUF302 domain-containing protein n=1 Tax=Catenulispora rubra TaxID=280293 RepID=UPI0018922CEF|nr:DUF302 domain-containing protein [Catenulispora rubra]
MSENPHVVTKTASTSVTETSRRLLELLEHAGATVFAIIDQAAAARTVGQDLRETILVLFGNPAAGTPVMAAQPLAALDLPLRILIWDDNGTTRVSYLDPAALADRYGVDSELLGKLGAVHVLSDKLAAAAA